MNNSIITDIYLGKIISEYYNGDKVVDNKYLAKNVFHKYDFHNPKILNDAIAKYEDKLILLDSKIKEYGMGEHELIIRDYYEILPREYKYKFVIPISHKNDYYESNEFMLLLEYLGYEVDSFKIKKDGDNYRHEIKVSVIHYD